MTACADADGGARGGARDGVRAFVALDVDDAGRAHLASQVERLRETMPASLRARFVVPENMHCTLKFLGAMALDDVPSWDAALAGMAAPRTRVMPLDAFGSMRRAHVVVAPLDDADGDLAGLAARVEAHAELLGFPRESRPFRAHVTLARLRVDADVRAWLARAGEATGAPDAPVRITHVTLYRSVTDAAGPRYTPLVRHALTA